MRLVVPPSLVPPPSLGLEFSVRFFYFACFSPNFFHPFLFWTGFVSSQLSTMRALVFLSAARAHTMQESAAALSPMMLSNSTVEGAGETVACPNKCTGNGDCVSGTCKCFPGYTFYDCSLRA